MANEGSDFSPFVDALSDELTKLESGKVYFVVDKVSKDNTLDLCNDLSARDKRFVTIWAPNNKNVVDAYMMGYKEACTNQHEFIIEMDAGLSHDPRALSMFLGALNEGNECVFGSRFINGGSIDESSWKRTFLSKAGPVLSNVLLGTRLYDATSGFQGFHIDIVKKFTEYEFLSKGHFYQTEIRFLLRKTRFVEIPIHYRAPSPRVSKSAVFNSVQVLFHYFLLRLQHKAPLI